MRRITPQKARRFRGSCLAGLDTIRRRRLVPYALAEIESYYKYLK